MKQGKHMVQQTKRRDFSRTGILLVSVFLLAVCIVGGTLAFLVDDTGPVKNTFTPAKVDCEVNETVNGTTKSSVTVKNTGNVDAYIRVAVIGNTVDENGNITGSFDASSYLAGTGWTPGVDGFYYWGEKLAPNGSTDNLLKMNLDYAGKNVTILADAIQADGVASTSTVGTSGQTPSQIAWGWTPAA